MKVVIICGGKGERLREETEFKPKPLVEIWGYADFSSYYENLFPLWF